MQGSAGVRVEKFGKDKRDSRGGEFGGKQDSRKKGKVKRGKRRDDDQSGF